MRGKSKFCAAGLVLALVIGAPAPGARSENDPAEEVSLETLSRQLEEMRRGMEEMRPRHEEETRALRKQIEALDAQDITSALRRVPGVVISRYNLVGCYGGGDAARCSSGVTDPPGRGAGIATMVDSVFVHKMWNDDEITKMVDGGVPFPMLSDGGGKVGKVGKVYGIYDEDAGIETRGRFLIDPDGVIQGFEVLTPPVGRNVGETIRQIQAFQLVRETGGSQATPSGWRPGRPTLKPGPDLVGNVWKVWMTNMAFD